MTCAQRLKRVFNIDIEIRDAGGGHIKIIACIEDPAIIQRILDPLDQGAIPTETSITRPARAPPQLHLTGLND